VPPALDRGPRQPCHNVGDGSATVLGARGRPRILGLYNWGANSLTWLGNAHWLINDYSSRSEPRLYLPQYLDQTNHVGLFEHAFDTIAVEIREGSFIKQLRVHDAARGEVINNKVEEFELIRSEPAAIQEFSEGTLSRLPIKTHQSADKARKNATATMSLV
jgi:hypothetical protein